MNLSPSHPCINPPMASHRTGNKATSPLGLTKPCVPSVCTSRRVPLPSWDSSPTGYLSVPRCSSASVLLHTLTPLARFPHHDPNTPPLGAPHCPHPLPFSVVTPSAGMNCLWDPLCSHPPFRTGVSQKLLFPGPCPQPG